MTLKCQKCECNHITVDNLMEICENCLSTTIYNSDNTIKEQVIVEDAFFNEYRAIRDTLFSEDDQTQLRQCLKLISLNKRLPFLWNYCGVLCMRMARYDEAIKYLKNAVSLHSAYGTAYCNLANAYYKSGSDKLSVNSYKQAIKFSSPAEENYASILGDFSLLLARMNMIENSQMYLEKALSHGYAYSDTVQNELALANRRVTEQKANIPAPAPVSTPTTVHNHITNNNLFVGNGAVGQHLGLKYPVVEEFSTKLKTSSVVWMIIGIMQIVIGFASVGISLGSILISVCGISNVFASIKLNKKSQEFSETGRGMVEFVQGNTLGSVIATGIWNFLFGGVVGIVISIFEYIIYDYGKKHLQEFISIENSTNMIEAK